jgi:hypothetical protein
VGNFVENLVDRSDGYTLDPFHIDATTTRCHNVPAALPCLVSKRASAATVLTHSQSQMSGEEKSHTSSSKVSSNIPNTGSHLRRSQPIRAQSLGRTALQWAEALGSRPPGNLRPRSPPMARAHLHCNPLQRPLQPCANCRPQSRGRMNRSRTCRFKTLPGQTFEAGFSEI